MEKTLFIGFGLVLVAGFGYYAIHHETTPAAPPAPPYGGAPANTQGGSDNSAAIAAGLNAGLQIGGTVFNYVSNLSS